MRHTYERILQLELITLGLSIVLGFISLFNGSLFFLFFSLYMLALSLACDAYSHQFTTYRNMQGIKQLVRAALIVILTTIFIFHL
ncbi:hypothetical protein M3210_15675 [Oceanobacillus luteolus]|uniref:DUF4181 domain-containing protein n=1 Tax=Oceanobacillus luteolus TaxID=1274358 RepID=A0ABW4HLW6_9BACI|nr:hypothetical protein [Oceanobacillus luteolus]MCM3741693.1 hypothetical protein [Oceanobacillus luteolus]